MPNGSSHSDPLGGQHDVSAGRNSLPFLERLAEGIHSLWIVLDYIWADMRRREFEHAGTGDLGEKYEADESMKGSARGPAKSPNLFAYCVLRK